MRYQLLNQIFYYFFLFSFGNITEINHLINIRNIYYDNKFLIFMNNSQNSYTALRNQKDLYNILEKKTIAIRLWTCIFFGYQHTCIVDHIAALTLKDIPITQQVLSKFQKFNDFVTELKTGFIITFNKQKKLYKLNLDLIQHLRTVLIDKIRTKVKSDMDQYGINPHTYKICTRCKTINEKKIINQGFACTSCKGFDFTQIQHNQENEKRLKKVQTLIGEVVKIIEDIQRAQNELNKNKATQEEEFSYKIKRKVTNIDQFMNKIEQKVEPQKVKALKSELNPKIIEISEKKYAPKNVYKKVNQLKNILKKRKLHNKMSEIMLNQN